MKGFFKKRYLQLLTFLLWQFLAKVRKTFPLQYTLAAILVLWEVQVTTPSIFDCLGLQVQSRANYPTLNEGHRLFPEIWKLWSAEICACVYLPCARVRGFAGRSSVQRTSGEENCRSSQIEVNLWAPVGWKWSSFNGRRPAKLQIYRVQLWRCKWNSRLGN